MKKPSGGNNGLLNELQSGLVYVNTRLDDNTNRVVNDAAKLAALIAILGEKGILEPEEVEERSKRILLDLVMAFAESGIGVEYLDSKYDEQDPEDDVLIDCGARVSACKAICCRLPFALTRKEVETGIIRWNFRRPYLIAKGTDGYCAHFDRDKLTCTIYENRPVSCRLFDCRTDKRWPVWEDFEKKIANVELIKKAFITKLNRPETL
jgi:Fe-S-cluster containining protein